jgi:hypothetical protein
MEVIPYVTPMDSCEKPMIYIPSDDAEILAFEFYTGKLIARLPGMQNQRTGRVASVAGRYVQQVSCTFPC